MRLECGWCFSPHSQCHFCSLRASQAGGKAGGAAEPPPPRPKPEACEKCGGGHKPDKIVQCDRCDKGWHMFCLAPPLAAAPKGEWVCPDCRSKGERGFCCSGAACPAPCLSPVPRFLSPSLVLPAPQSMAHHAATQAPKHTPTKIIALPVPCPPLPCPLPSQSSRRLPSRTPTTTPSKSLRASPPLLRSSGSGPRPARCGGAAGSGVGEGARGWGEGRGRIAGKGRPVGEAGRQAEAPPDPPVHTSLHLSPLRTARS